MKGRKSWGRIKNVRWEALLSEPLYNKQNIYTGTYLIFFVAGSLGATGLLFISWDEGGCEGLWKSEGRLHTARGSDEDGGHRGWAFSEHSPSTIIISPSSSVSSAGVSKTSSFTSISDLTETCGYHISATVLYCTSQISNPLSPLISQL